MPSGFDDATMIGGHHATLPWGNTPEKTDRNAEIEPERAILTGKGRYLADSCLLAATVGIVTAGYGKTEILSSTLLGRFGSFAGVLCASNEELNGIAEMGVHLLPAIRLLQDLAFRYNRARVGNEDLLADPEKLLDYLTARLAREAIEQFRIVFLNDCGGLLADEAQARGTVNHTPVYPREVARRAMELGAAKLILVHNHPSGDPTPSEADLIMTRQVAAATEAIGISVADHIIIGNGRHTSFRAIGAL